jgi:hypothetical protein
MAVDHHRIFHATIIDGSFAVRQWVFWTPGKGGLIICPAMNKRTGGPIDLEKGYGTWKQPPPAATGDRAKQHP